MSNEARSIENNESVYHLKANQQKVLKLSGLEPSTFIIRPNYKTLKKKNKNTINALKNQLF